MLSIQHPPSSQISRVQQDVRAAVVALHVWDCSAGLGTPIAWCGGQQKGDSTEFGHSGFFQATRVLQVLPSANKEEQEALGKDDLLV